MNLRRAFVAVAIVGGLAACGKSEKPDDFVQASLKAVEGEPQALWKALPKSYQDDVNKLVADFAAKMNEQIWNDGFVVAQKASKVLESKKEFVLGHPMVGSFVKPEDMSKGIDPVVRTIGRLVNSDLATLKGLKKLDVESFLAGPVADSMVDITKAVEVAAAAAPHGAPKMKDMVAKMKAAKVTIESAEAETAKVKVEIEGEKTEIVEMVKVEGKWIPKDLAQAWPHFMSEARASVEKMKIDPAMVVQFAAMKGTAEAVLDGLLKAKTQEEFNAQIDAVAGGFGGRPSAKMAQAPESFDDAEKPAAAAAKKPVKAPKAVKRGRRR